MIAGQGLFDEIRRLQHIFDVIAEGQVRPVLDSVYDRDNVVEAYERLESGRVSGKVVLRHHPSMTTD